MLFWAWKSYCPNRILFREKSIGIGAIYFSVKHDLNFHFFGIPGFVIPIFKIFELNFSCFVNYWNLVSESISDSLSRLVNVRLLFQLSGCVFNRKTFCHLFCRVHDLNRHDHATLKSNLCGFTPCQRHILNRDRLHFGVNVKTFW